MIAKVSAVDRDAPIAILDIGNTSIRMARWHRGQVIGAVGAASLGPELPEALKALLDSFPGGDPQAMVISAVSKSGLDRVRELVAERSSREPLVIGRNIDVPIDVALKEPLSVGTDRLCAAAAAFHTLKTACTIVDFGTAVTVDLVDDEGAFLGGAILPGLRMQLKAMHEFTDALPQVEPGIPGTAYGTTTPEAMQTGVCRGMAGAVRAIVEGYATSRNQWMHVVATGGDIEFMAPHCDFLDSLVSDLTLAGVGLAHDRHLQSRGA